MAFECSQCGLIDALGQFNLCPVCDQSLFENRESECFFLNLNVPRCRMDGNPCPYAVNKKFDECYKLQ